MNKKLKALFLFISLLSFHVVALSAANDSIKFVELRIEYFQNQLKLKELVSFIDSINTHEPGILLVRAKTLYQLGDKLGMLDTFQRIYSENDGNVAVLSELAGVAEAVGEKEIAIQALDKSTLSEPLPALMMRKGDLAYSLKRYSRSLQIADTMLMQSILPQAVRLKSRNLAALKRYPESVATLK